MVRTADKKKELIEGLNEDLAAEYGTIIRYNYQAGVSSGIAGLEVRDLFRKELQDEIGHAAYLTDVIIDLGGQPVIEPKAFERKTKLKDMIGQDIEHEQQDVENYKKHSELAEELGLVELKVKLEEMAADEARHARELNRIHKGL